MTVRFDTNSGKLYFVNEDGSEQQIITGDEPSTAQNIATSIPDEASAFVEGALDPISRGEHFKDKAPVSGTLGQIAGSTGLMGAALKNLVKTGGKKAVEKAAPKLEKGWKQMGDIKYKPDRPGTVIKDLKPENFNKVKEYAGHDVARKLEKAGALDRELRPEQIHKLVKHFEKKGFDDIKRSTELIEKILKE